MQLTNHARSRCQQRGVPALLLDLLFQFGATERAGDGASKVFFDKRSRKQLRSYAGALASTIEQHLDIYAVLSADNTVITVGHRLERINRN